MRLRDIYTIAVNLADLPGMSDPSPASGEYAGRPAADRQLFRRARLLRVAHQLQLARPTVRQPVRASIRI